MLPLLIVALAATVSARDCGKCGWWPVCCSASSQTSKEGWGWESDKNSCVVRGTAAQRQECSGGVSGGGSGSGGGGGSGCGSVKLPACPHGLRCGCEESEALGRNKRRLVSLGASAAFLASAMMETADLTTNYPYGDNKSGDSFNAGLCKQNWGQSRHCYGPWRRYGQDDYRRMDVLNSNERMDIAVYRACTAGRQTAFLRSHRGRCPGMSSSQVRADQQRFIDVWKWTLNLVKNHMRDDLRFWVKVPAC